MIKKNLCNLFVLILFLNFSGYGQVTEHYINIKLWVVSNSAGVGLTPTQVENEVIPTVETAFLGLNNATNTFHLNFCAEYFIDDGLHENPNLFKDSECEFLHTPGFMNFLLHDNAERGGCAGSNEGEGDRGFSLRDFQLAHEIGHFLNLYHLNHTCVGNHLDNWQVGDPLGISSSRDFVEDTPFSPIVQVNDTTGEIIFPIYQADGCNVDWSASFSCNDVGYPENYSWEDDGTGQLVYNPVWETNIMVNFWRGGCGHDVNRNFTSGQHDRMRSHILTGNLPYVSMTPKTCPNPVLPLPTSSSVLTPAILNGPQPITGNYVINNDISIASTVIFDVANIEVRNGVKITVAPSGQLDLNSVVFSSLGSCSNAGWQGIEVVDGGKISMDNVEINDAAIGLDLKSRDADLYWAKFINCALGMVAEFGSNNSYEIETTNLVFSDSPVSLIDSKIKFFGGRFHNSPITVTDEGSLWFDISNRGNLDESARPTFLKSPIDFDGEALIVNHGYFDGFSIIEAKKAEIVGVCWSFFDGSAPGNSNIELDSVETYQIYGCFFNDDQFEHQIVAYNTSTGTHDSRGSYVNNNIFSGINTSFDASGDKHVEISCNFHDDGAPNSYITPAGFDAQGRSTHPAGNKFSTLSTKVDIVPAGTFDYYFDTNDAARQRPGIPNVGATIERIDATFAETSRCFTREEITDQNLWDEFKDNECHLFSDEWFLGYCECPAPPPLVGPPTVNYPPPGPGDSSDGNYGKNSNRNESDQLMGSVDIVATELIVKTTDGKIDIQSQLSGITVTLTDVSGKVLLRSKLHDNFLSQDISHLSSGIYIINFIDDEGHLIRNQMIQHTK